MKPFAYAGFAVLAAVMIGLFAVGIYSTTNWEDKDDPKVAAKKEQCRKLSRHLFEILPEAKGQNPDELVAKVPIEDIEQCAAANQDSVACMLAAPDHARVQACIPVGVECSEPITVVEGDRPIYEVGGDCQTVTVKTSKAIVQVKGAKQVEIAGNDNVVSAKVDALIASGNHNQIEVKSREEKKTVNVTDRCLQNTVTGDVAPASGAAQLERK